MAREVVTRLTRKGQVTIPAAVRELLGLKPRDAVRFEIEGDTVRLRPALSELLDGFGAVVPRQRPEDWRQVRAVVEQAIADEAVRER